ncbi:MAG: ASKHA domain-containing protein [Acidimicrobiales bacterium]
MTDHRVVFTPAGLVGTVADDTTVLDAARILGADLDTICGGRGLCGRCQIEPARGVHAKWSVTVGDQALSSRGTTELDYLGRRPLGPGRRLGCASRIHGDVVIDIPAESQIHQQIVRKDLDLDDVAVDPRYRLFYIEVPPPETGWDHDAEAGVLSAIDTQHQVRVDQMAPAMRHRLPQSLADGTATVAVSSGAVVGVWPGYCDQVFGLAIDIGSTTVAGHLCDLFSGTILASAGRMNPQIRYGEDLMSRVSYVMMNEGGDVELTTAIRDALGGLARDLIDQAGIDANAVLEVVLVANPVMHHIALGLDPIPLGAAPFVLATDQPVVGQADDVGINLAQAALYVGPCIAGHVGADTTAAILAEGPHRSHEMQLLVDVGTNAEIVLGDQTRQFAASSPTGPAFEGAQISCGQRATVGAIERVRIDPDTLTPRVKVIGSDRWSDEDGFADELGPNGVTGVCGSGIIEAVAEMFLAGVIDADGVLAAKPDNPHVVPDGRTYRYILHADTPVTITQNDVRAIQLAKAALRAGIDLLIEHAGRPAIADVRLAGAFGAHISPLHAMVLGLIPDCPVGRVRAVGNAAGAGAVQALLSGEARAEMEAAAQSVTKIETATEARFQELFVAAMAFPHATAPAPNLAGEVTLPDRPTSRDKPARRRRRSADAAAQKGH